MSWQGEEGGIAAAKQGSYVVMTPGSHCYFDYYQGDPTNEPLAIGGYIPVEKVYAYEPIPAVLTPNQQKYILGAQGNLWTEYIGSEKQVEYMIFPRLCALSEVVWSPTKSRNYPDFRKRLLSHFATFDKRGVNYAKSIFEIKKNVIADTLKHSLLLELTREFPVGDLYYWFEDEKGAMGEQRKYETPIPVTTSCTVHVESRDSNQRVNNSIAQKFIITKSSGASIRLTNPPSPKYNYNSPYSLVDGVSGSIPWNGKEWLGFVDNPLEAVIDLGKIQEISEVLIHALKAEASWIYLPKIVRVEVSENGTDYVKFGEMNEPEISNVGRMIRVKNNPMKARYVKVYVEGLGLLGKGKAGEGNNAWLFVSEIGIE
jgi:hexosaminidase